MLAQMPFFPGEHLSCERPQKPGSPYTRSSQHSPDNKAAPQKVYLKPLKHFPRLVLESAEGKSENEIEVLKGLDIEAHRWRYETREEDVMG